jgi:hypothetical protein
MGCEKCSDKGGSGLFATADFKLAAAIVTATKTPQLGVAALEGENKLQVIFPKTPEVLTAVDQYNNNTLVSDLSLFSRNVQRLELCRVRAIAIILAPPA